jgi:protein-tyrosine phosphatase
VGYVDLHCHLLPGVDDGPRTLDESVAYALDMLVHQLPGPHEHVGGRPG